MDKNSSSEAYTSCNIIEHGFDAQVASINLCCRETRSFRLKPLILIGPYCGEKIDWGKLFDKKNQLRTIQKSNKILPNCIGCIYLEHKIWGDENYINSININNWIKCNAKCIYCKRQAVYKTTKEYNIYPIIKDLIKNKYLKTPCDITIAGGEPTIKRDFDKTLNLMIKNEIYNIRILTNAIKYNKLIEKGLNLGFVNILVSTDSGTEKMYQAIKQTNKHKQVWQNIKKYVKFQKTDSLVKTKYIIIPEYNDKETEITEYIKRNSEAGVKNTAIDIEIDSFIIKNKDSAFLKRMKELYIFARELSKEYDIVTEPFDRMKVVLENIKI